jgi:hypothetical protein
LHHFREELHHFGEELHYFGSNLLALLGHRTRTSPVDELDI